MGIFNRPDPAPNLPALAITTMPVIIHHEDREHFEIVCRALADEPVHVAMVCPDALKCHDYANALQVWLRANCRACVETYDANRLENFIADALLSRFDHALASLSDKRGNNNNNNYGAHILLIREASALSLAEFRHLIKLVSDRVRLVALFSARDALADNEKIQLLGSSLLRWDIDRTVAAVQKPEPDSKHHLHLHMPLPRPATLIRLACVTTLTGLFILLGASWLTAPESALQANAASPANQTVINGTIARAELPAQQQD